MEQIKLTEVSNYVYTCFMYTHSSGLQYVKREAQISLNIQLLQINDFTE